MAKKLRTTKPEAFGIGSFADILPARDPIIGEDPGSFDGFQKAMIATLANCRLNRSCNFKTGLRAFTCP